MSLVYADTEPMDTPIYRTVRRTPFERLFSLPWRPWVATKEERDYQAEAVARIEELHQRLRDWRATRPIASRSLPARVSGIHMPSTLTTGTATVYGYPPSVTAFTIAPASFAPPAIGFPLPDVTERGNSGFVSLGGGDFGGAGATSSWENGGTMMPWEPSPAPAPATDTYQASSNYSEPSSSCSSDSSSSPSSDSSSSCSSGSE